MNDHLNELTRLKTNSVKGWVFDCTVGSWTAPYVDSKNCKNWFGWRPNDPVGSISTTLNGQGKAELDFGNCFCPGGAGGTVVAYIDGIEIGSASSCSGGSKKVHFQFSHGSKLKIIEENTAIIQFNSLNIIDCTLGMLTHQISIWS